MSYDRFNLAKVHSFTNVTSKETSPELAPRPSIAFTSEDSTNTSSASLNSSHRIMMPNVHTSIHANQVLADNSFDQTHQEDQSENSDSDFVPEPYGRGPKDTGLQGDPNPGDEEIPLLETTLGR